MHKRLWVCGIALTILVCTVLWTGNEDHLNLLEHSARITSVRAWGLERPDLDISPRIYGLMTGGAQYQWVSNKQILFFHDLQPIRETTTPGAGGAPNTNLSWPASVGIPTLYDVTTHTETPLPKLTKLFRNSSGKAQGATVSPDGSRLIWHDAKEHLHCATLDGLQDVRIANDGDPGMGWSMDPKQFYTYGWGEDAQKKSAIAVHNWDVNSGKYLGERLFSTSIVYSFLGDCVLLPDGVLATNTMQVPQVKLTLDRISPPPGSMVTAAVPPLPADAKVESLVYSPQGDRLAWVITRSVLSPMAALLSRLPHSHPTPTRIFALCVSGTMGENLHEIGHIAVQPGGRQFYLIDYVRWQPDGKTLSFVSNDTLYTVPAN